MHFEMIPTVQSPVTDALQLRIGDGTLQEILRIWLNPTYLSGHADYSNSGTGYTVSELWTTRKGL